MMFELEQKSFFEFKIYSFWLYFGHQCLFYVGIFYCDNFLHLNLLIAKIKKFSFDESARMLKGYGVGRTLSATFFLDYQD